MPIAKLKYSIWFVPLNNFKCILFGVNSGRVGFGGKSGEGVSGKEFEHQNGIGVQGTSWVKKVKKNEKWRGGKYFGKWGGDGGKLGDGVSGKESEVEMENVEKKKKKIQNDLWITGLNPVFFQI